MDTDEQIRLLFEGREQELRIYYNGKLDPELDDALRKTLSQFGYKGWASGYDLVSHVRDLAFDLE